jgi:outer membrane lipoprotein-sorting protein
MTFSRVKEWSGRKLPTVMTLTPADKPGEKTTITYQEIHFDVSLSDEIFSLRNLQE